MTTIGTVYKIYCVKDSAPQLYVGSTKRYEKREQSHRYKCSNPESDGYMRRVYRYIRANGGWDQFRMEPIETVEYEDVLELRLHERYWIEKLKTTLNCCIPTRTDAEYRADNAERIRLHKQEFQQTHAESIARTKRAYYVEHKDQITQSIAAYKEANRETVLRRYKDYYQEHKAEQLSQQGQLFNCECGKELTVGKRARHLLSARHLAFLGANAPPELLSKIEAHKSKQRVEMVQKSQYVTCECGQQITRNKLTRHVKTARHLALISARLIQPSV